jgi:hypothetical protein
MFLQTLKQYIEPVTMLVQLLFYIKLKPVLSLDGVFIWACLHFHSLYYSIIVGLLYNISFIPYFP